MIRRALVSLGLLVAASLAPSAQVMPDISQMAGVPLPASDLAVGTVSVRVIRESFANNLANVDVVLDVDGREVRTKTDDTGRAQMTAIPRGARVVARVDVNGEKAESQPFTMNNTGVRLVLALGVATPAPGAKPAAARGDVTLGADSRVVIDFSGERLNVYYVIQVVNSHNVPVDPGGPIIIDLPEGALGTTILEGSTPQATANGPRVTVLAPFAPGITSVHVGFELRSDGATATLEQRLPLALPGFAVFVLQTENLDVQSAQLASKQLVTQQGQPILAGRGTAVAAGQPIVMTISGLPHHPRWPIYVGLTMAGAIILLGVWGAFGPQRRRDA